MGRLYAALSLLVFLSAFPFKTAGQRNAGNTGSDSVSITGTVFTENGDHPIQQAFVRLCDGGENLVEEMTTNNTGQFTFRRLRRGNYVLVVSASGFVTNTTQMELSFNSGRGLSIYLKPTVSNSKTTGPASSISAHEMSMPKAARDLLASGMKKLYLDKDSEGALADFHAAISSAPGYYEAYYQAALAYVALGKRDDAEKNMQKAIAVSGDKYGEGQVGLGAIMINRGAWAEGKERLVRGVELSPNFWLGHYELGRALVNENQLSEAQKSAEQARSLAPGSPLVYELLSVIHQRQKDYLALLADIDAFIKLDPDSPGAARARQLRQEVAEKLAPVDTPTAADKKP
jgi:carboxypeptidase family protein/tetratricopeptide repeat protein